MGVGVGNAELVENVSNTLDYHVKPVLVRDLTIWPSSLFTGNE